MKPPQFSPRDLTDRVFRRTLENVQNLEEFLQEALPEHAAALDGAHPRLLPREFVADDWRGREADLLFEIPYWQPNGDARALVGLLIEHQTRTDVLMPFRTLSLAVSFWDRQWRDWQALAPPRPELRFTPVIPIVLFTGPTPWGSTQRMADLLAEPSVFHSFAPTSEPLFWNLAEHTAEELLQRGSGWRNLLAVIRSERAEADAFRNVTLTAVQQLEAIHTADRPRWQELIQALLTWAHTHRPQAEHPGLQTGAEALLADPILKQEFHAVSEQTVEYLYDRGVLQGLAQGRVEGREEGREEALHQALIELLTARFGPLPDDVKQRIEATTNLDQLRKAVVGVLHMQGIEDLSL